MVSLFNAFNQFCASIVAPLANLAARIYMGYYIFFVSGLAKLDDFEGTVELFEEDWIVPVLSNTPTFAAFMATAGELILPVLLIAGLFTRIGAAGLLVMSIVIQVFAIQDPQHYLWMLILALLVGYGGDKLSLDNLLFNKD